MGSISSRILNDDDKVIDLGKERRKLSRRRSSIPLVFQNENPQSQKDRHKIAAMENAHNITITKSQEVKVRTEEDSIAFWMQREPSENEKIDIAKRRERRFSQLEDSIQSFQQIYDETHKEGSHVEESKTELSENEKIDIAKRHERRFSQLEDSIQSFLERYRVLSEHSVAEESLENEVESQQSDMEQCKETEEEPSNHPIQKLYSDESLLSE